MERNVGDKLLFEEEPLIFHLIRAEGHLSNALDLIYGRNWKGVKYKRHLLWRLSLLRAQNITMKLLVRELAKAERREDELDPR